MLLQAVEQSGRFFHPLYGIEWGTAETAEPGTINGDAFDRFTLVHGLVGSVYGLIGLKPLTAASLAVGWELLERPLKDNVPEIFPHSSQDTAVNALFDVMAVLGGWWIGNKLRQRHR